jgi:GABA permease
VILTAVLSALNSGLFASSRMLLSMARRGDAPRAFTKLSSRGVPALAILTGTVFGYCAVVMSYISPEGVFAFLVNSYGTVAIFVYLLIALSQLRLRAELERTSPERLHVRMWAYPYLTWLAILAMIGIVAAMAFIPEQRSSFAFGILSAVAMLVAYAVRRRVGSALHRASPAGP